MAGRRCKAADRFHRSQRLPSSEWLRFIFLNRRKGLGYCLFRMTPWSRPERENLACASILRRRELLISQEASGVKKDYDLSDPEK